MNDSKSDELRMDDSPSGLAPVRPKPKRLSGRLMAGIVGVGGLLLAVQLYSMFSTESKPSQETEPRQQAVTASTNTPLIKNEPAGGLALPEPKPADPAPPVQETLPKGKPVISADVEVWQQQREQLRQMKRQMELQALQSPLAVSVGASRTTGSSAGSMAGTREGIYGSQTSAAPKSPSSSGMASVGTGAGATQAYDATERADKESFLERRSLAGDQWRLGHARTPGARYELKTGTVVPGLLIAGINSDLPGQIIGQVSRNVYDTASGRFLLIPQGSRLVGQYDSRVAMGQQRILIAWQRIVFPDGSSLTLESMPGADQAGYAGLHDGVNNHYLRVFGNAFLMSMITGGMAWSVDALSTKQSSDNEKASVQDEMGSALASQLGQASLQLLQQNATIKPTLEIRPGYRFNVVLIKDLVFDRAYAPMPPIE